MDGDHLLPPLEECRLLVLIHKKIVQCSNGALERHRFGYIGQIPGDGNQEEITGIHMRPKRYRIQMS